MIYGDEFIKHLKVKGLAPGTIYYKEIYLNDFFEYLNEHGIYKVDGITPSMVEDYNKAIFCKTGKNTKKKLAPRTIFAKLYVIVQYFEYLAENKIIFINPALYLDLPKFKESLPKYIPTEKEVDALLARPDTSTYIGIRDRAILETVYSAGIRRQEVINLNVYDIDFANGILRVNQGKFKKDRTVPLGRAAGRWLERYIKEARPKWVKQKSEPILFVTIEGNSMKSQTLHYNIVKYASESVPGRRITCHSLRHACFSHMLRGGANLRFIQMQAGHKSLNTTQIYTHVNAVDLKKALKRYHPRERVRNKHKYL